MKLTSIILEQDGRPKVLVMAGGAGAGKSYVLDQINPFGSRNTQPR